MGMDAMVHAVMRSAGEVVQGRPEGGRVAALRKPVFVKDQDSSAFPSGLGWASCLAYGDEFRIVGMGLPTGFEWHLNLLEFLVFSVAWRFQGSVIFGSGLAFIINRVVLQVYGLFGRWRLAHTTVINPIFLL